MTYFYAGEILDSDGYQRANFQGTMESEPGTDLSDQPGHLKSLIEHNARIYECKPENVLMTAFIIVSV